MTRSREPIVLALALAAVALPIAAALYAAPAGSDTRRRPSLAGEGIHAAAGIGACGQQGFCRRATSVDASGIRLAGELRRRRGAATAALDVSRLGHLGVCRIGPVTMPGMLVDPLAS